ncbi:MAG: hypothetical protein ACM3VW_01430 [Bacteroidota bacterium]
MRHKFICLILLALCTSSWAAEMLLDEGFETPEALSSWQQSLSYTKASAELTAPGQLSEHALRLRKPDMCGLMTLKRQVPIKQAGYYRLTADMKSLMSLPYSRYFMMVTLSANGKAVGPNLFLAYDDGLMKDNDFGGAYKVPQTLGEWRTTEHILQIDPGIDTVTLQIVIADSQLELLMDNVRLEYVGPEPPARKQVRIFARRINWPYAELNLDMLLPGATYEVKVNCLRPNVPATLTGGLSPNAKLSPEVAPPGFQGMGISMRSVDYKGARSELSELVPAGTEGDTRTYLLTVPETAVAVELNLHNDDLVRFNHNQIEPQARRFGDIEVLLRSNGEIADDNQYYQYVYRGKRDDLRPRALDLLSDFDLTILRNKLAARKPLDAEVVSKNGGQFISIGGQPIPPMIAHTTTAGAEYQRYGQQLANGVKLISCRYPYWGPAMHGDWSGPGQYDFSDVDKALYRSLAQDPDASVLLVVDDIYAPHWWALQNPDELVQDQDGKVVFSAGRGLYNRRYVAKDKMAEAWEAQQKGGAFDKSWGAKYSGFFMASPASAKYHALVTDYLAALRRHIEAQPYGSAVVGYWFTWGYDGQWHMVDDPDPAAPHFTDFSPAMLQRFRAYLKDTYKTDAALQAAWHDPKVTLATASLPPVSMRESDQEKGNPYILDPDKYQPIIDYRVLEARTVGETLNTVCRAVKTAATRKVLTMAYYPDINGNCTGGAGGQSGHDVVLGDKWLDIAGNPGYEARELGQVGTTGLTVDSYPVHGKLPMKEIDHRLFTVLRRNYRNNIIFETPRKSIDILRREYSAAMCQNGGAWTFDMGYGWFEDPIIGGTIGQASRVFSSVLTRDRSPIGKIGVFYGEQGKNVQGDARRGSIPLTLVGKTTCMLGNAGLPVDAYRLTDLATVGSRYKVFYFPFAYGLTQAEVQAIEALKRDGNLLVFGPAAGMVSGSAYGLQQVGKLTGMELAEDAALTLTCEFKENAHPITRGLSGFMGSGGERGSEKGMPHLYVKDAKTVTLANFAGSDKAGVAFKDHGTWQSVYIGAIGLIPPQLLRNLGSFKGAHVYSDSGDPMYFCQSLIGMHAASDGTKEIALPAPARVTSLWDDKCLGVVQRFTRPMRTGDTELYLVEPVAAQGK